MTFLFLLYSLLLWAVAAWHDADYYNIKHGKLSKNGKPINEHISGGFLAVFIVIGIFILPVLGYSFSIKEWQNILFFAFINIIARAWIFDIIYNKRIGQEWSYIGESSWLDKLARKLNFAGLSYVWWIGKVIAGFFAICMCLWYSGIGNF